MLLPSRSHAAWGGVIVRFLAVYVVLTFFLLQ